MIVWFNKEATAKNTPSTHSLYIEGRMNEPGSGPLIEIVLIIEGPDDKREKQLFTHSPSIRYYETPDTDDILAKYQHKISALLSKLARTDFIKLDH